MKSSLIFYKINKDRYFLIKYYSVELLLLLSACIGFSKADFFSMISFTFLGLTCIFIFSILNGYFTAALLHNTSHGNIKNNFLNRIVGEYSGLWAMYGFGNFVLIHFLHHKYSDTEIDPVNPNDMSFILFLSAPMRYMIKAAEKYLLQTHGHHGDYRIIMLIQAVLFYINLSLRIALFYFLLGKILFFTFFLTSTLSMIFVFAHINYFCHQPNHLGETEIMNLNHNWYYKIANIITFGGYYHKNHHLNMRLFNPKYLSAHKPKFHPVVWLQTYIGDFVGKTFFS